MKSPEEYASGLFSNASELKRRSTTVKRIATGLLAEARQAEFHGLSHADVKTLEAAAQLISHLGSNLANAARTKKLKEDKLDKRMREASHALRMHIDTLTTVEERVALVSGAKLLGEIVRARTKLTPSVLGFVVEEAIGSLSYAYGKSTQTLSEWLGQVKENTEKELPNVRANLGHLVEALSPQPANK